jgi:hypothetical protein
MKREDFEKVTEQVSGGGVSDVEVKLDFGHGTNGTAESETLHAPALDSREAHITRSTKPDSLKRGKCSVVVPRKRITSHTNLSVWQFRFIYGQA